MTADRFLEIITQAFPPFLSELGFRLQQPHLSGRYYRATFVGCEHTLIVSFEPGDNNLVVMLMPNGHDDLAAIDDREKTPRLADLNQRYMNDVTADEVKSNDAFFASIETRDFNERRLLKCAKELRLVLPRYLAN